MIHSMSSPVEVIDFNLYDTKTVTHLNCKAVHFFSEPMGFGGKTRVETNMECSNVLPTCLLTVRAVQLIPLTPYPELMLFEILNGAIARFRIADRERYEGPLGELLAHYPHQDAQSKYTGLKLEKPWTLEPYTNFMFWCEWTALPTWVNFTFKINFVSLKKRPT